MLRIIIALTVMAVGLSMTVRAADAVLTLACQGTTSDRMKDAKDTKPEPLSIGVIVNFTNRTVQGLLLPSSESVPITDVTDLAIVFGGPLTQGSVNGNIDRVTGELVAAFFWSNAISTHYTLKCSPAQRMF
jgi:hypothetical protein